LLSAARGGNEVTNFFEPGAVAFMSLWKNENVYAALDVLTANNFSRNDIVFVFGNRDRREYGIRFNSRNIDAAEGVEHPVKSLDDVNLVRLELIFLPHDAEIVGGSVELIVNNNIRKMFQILPQDVTNSPFGFPVNSPSSGTADEAYTVYATNVVQKLAN
jgi:hypothetical protein